MASDLQQQLQRVGGKTRLIAESYARLKAETVQAKEEIGSLRAQVLALQSELDRLKVENEYLRVVSTIVPERKDLLKTKAMISELVREIDRCILDLNE